MNSLDLAEKELLKCLDDHRVFLKNTLDTCKELGRAWRTYSKSTHTRLQHLQRTIEGAEDLPLYRPADISIPIESDVVADELNQMADVIKEARHLVEEAREYEEEDEDV